MLSLVRKVFVLFMYIFTNYTHTQFVINQNSLIILLQENLSKSEIISL